MNEDLRKELAENLKATAAIYRSYAEIHKALDEVRDLELKPLYEKRKELLNMSYLEHGLEKRL